MGLWGAIETSQAAPVTSIRPGRPFFVGGCLSGCDASYTTTRMRGEMEEVGGGRQGVAQLGRAPSLGGGGRRFESGHPDSPLANREERVDRRKENVARRPLGVDRAHIDNEGLSSVSLLLSPFPVDHGVARWRLRLKISRSIRSRLISPTVFSRQPNSSRVVTGSWLTNSIGVSLDCREHRRGERPVHETRSQAFLRHRSGIDSGMRAVAGVSTAAKTSHCRRA